MKAHDFSRRPLILRARVLRRAAAWVAAGAAIATGTAACASANAGTGKAAANPVISVTTGGCGGHWHLDSPGWHSFQIKNDATVGGEVYLINPANNAIFGEVDNIGPGTTTPMQVNVGSGTYAFECLMEDTDTLIGPSVRVPGHYHGQPGTLPVTYNDLYKPSQEYHLYVTAGLVVLARQVKTLTSDILAGRMAAARQAWLPAHLTYERLGAAYDTFGPYDDKIDERADGLHGTVHSSKWTGFYRLEYGLWHGQTAAQMKVPATKLLHSVLGLKKAFPGMQVDLLDVGLRTHEILENALEFQLSDHDNYGSGTTLATTEANITGTRELLKVLHPLLVKRYAALPAVGTWLTRLQKLLEAQHSSSGSWTPVKKLSPAERERIDAAAGQALTELAPIAAITEPRRI